MAFPKMSPAHVYLLAAWHLDPHLAQVKDKDVAEQGTAGTKTVPQTKPNCDIGSLLLFPHALL